MNQLCEIDFFRPEKKVKYKEDYKKKNKKKTMSVS